MSISNVTRTAAAERLRITYTPDQGTGNAGTVDVFVNTTKSGTDRAVIKALPVNGRANVLLNRAYGFSVVYADLTGPQQNTFGNALRGDLEAIFGVTISTNAQLAIDEQEVYVDQFSATWTGELATSFAFTAYLDTEQELVLLDGPDANTEADVTFRYRLPRWEILTAAQRAKVEVLVDQFVGSFFGEFAA